MQTRAGFLREVTVMLLAEACNLWSVKLGKSRDVIFLQLSSRNFCCVLDDEYAGHHDRREIELWGV